LPARHHSDYDAEVLRPFYVARDADNAKRAAEKARQDALEAAQALAAAQEAQRSAATSQTAYTASAFGMGDIQAIIIAAANSHGVNAATMLRIAKCESSFNPSAIAPNLIDGGHPSGLFQHVMTYWPARAAAYGYPGASVFDAVANANVTAAMMAAQGTGAWECQ
jgi:hypothetical protein